jgi:hypothetical protein
MTMMTNREEMVPMGCGSSGPDFFQTGMGRKFYEHDIPELIRQLKAQNLLKLAEFTENEEEKKKLIEKAKREIGI